MSDRDVWLTLVDRHLVMAQHLGQVHMYEGALFHTYHAFECFVSAGLSSQGHDPSRPPRRLVRAGPHAAVFDWFDDSYKNQPVAMAAVALQVFLCSLTQKPSYRVNHLRNCCLYHQKGSQPPWLTFDHAGFAEAHTRVSELVAKFAPAI
jgi:hypothetical protein